MSSMIADNLEHVQSQIREAERAAGRESGSVTLLPVSKFHPVEAIREVAARDITMVGENREQEAREKAAKLDDACGIAMIGQIQSKKANSVARWASEVHSLDSVKLANGLDRGMSLALERGDRTSDTLPCLIQVSADGDTSRGGITREGLDELVAATEGAAHLRLKGFMVVPPLDAEPRAVFEELRSLTDEYSERVGRNLVLSAGMSGDFETAIACGSDIVRVGTAVFGPRPVV
ncbi:YggS family pyridoxal phosphate-dependent enzyme [Corynebacterium glaucum]|uniref:YggS family pyridoxal phosphate-dependent enzyme n=1 Tax=Corynebacterium glaucum TaxID=187491 RepID=UPI0025B559F5|nr:YggS family pyridoxal phosphate-dependent enzyme [Corynebacterium glaucum]WJZ08132.1 hypothetical protein CGLAUT_08255 [Corynebacterium glaucum]